MPVIKLFRNKYFIALAAFIALMLFVDHNDIFVQLERRKELNELLASKKYYEQQIKQTQKNLNDLQHSAAALEKFAREKYQMKRDNEDVFVITSSSAQKNAAGKQ